ncbi:MAG: hypothetical protein KGV51_06900 [Moraxellaceae bacterium]|nr:hypothetical protein [Moraxellaceae bacterium]
MKKIKTERVYGVHKDNRHIDMPNEKFSYTYHNTPKGKEWLKLISVEIELSVNLVASFQVDLSEEENKKHYSKKLAQLTKVDVFDNEEQAIAELDYEEVA